MLAQRILLKELTSLSNNFGRKVMAVSERKSLSPYDRWLKPILPYVPRRLKPNHLTLVRLVGSPFLIWPLVERHYVIALAGFVLLALTDMFDGAMARGRNQITEWGQNWDPIADKVLIICVIAVLLLQTNIWLAVAIFAMEGLMVLGGLQQKVRYRKVDFQSDAYGKIKMNFQCLGAGFLLLGYLINSTDVRLLAQWLFGLGLVFATLSLMVHVKRFRAFSAAVWEEGQTIRKKI